VTGPISAHRRLRDLVNVGVLEDWAAASSQPEPLMSINALEMVFTVKFSRSRNERMRLKIWGDERVERVRERDLIRGENLWNGTKETGLTNELSARTSKHATRENPVTQPPTSESAVVTSWGQLMSRVLA
jgi:hypothetical protein